MLRRFREPFGKVGLTIAVACLVIWAPGFIASGGLLAPSFADAAGCPNEAFRSGASAGLPDCRAYEKVSPAEKGGGDAVRNGFPSQATADGGGLSFMSFGTFAGSPSGSFPNAYVARRGESGWQTTSVSPPTPDPGSPGANLDSYEFSADLSQHVVTNLLQGLAEGASPLYENMYRVDGAGNYSWINNMDYPVKLPDECPAPPIFETLCWEFVDAVTFAGSSADFQHVLFQSNASVFTGIEKLFRSDYENGHWQVSEVGILPDGNPVAGSSTAGSGGVYTSLSPEGDRRVDTAMSADGSNVIFQAESDEGEPNEAGQAGLIQVYDRIDRTHTIELSAPAPGATPANPAAGPATFWAASRDGSRVFFTSPAELTTPSNTGPAQEGNDLYEYNFAGGGTLTDLTVDSADPAGASVLGVVEASADGSTIYFVARGELAPGEGVPGEPNLYMVRNGGTPVFIATLAESDERDWTPSAAGRHAYVTPNGNYLAFMSSKTLPTTNFPSGYDNVNPTTSSPEPEVYEYSAPTGELVCASCDPSGAPPSGPGVIGGSRRPEGVGTTQNSPFHMVRAVTEDGGRVFFSSQDPLVPSVPATSSKAKVYEFEHAGVGSCTTPGGCVNLLSSPTDTREAVFMEADENGQNVFIATGAQLTAADHDNALDVYDVRVDGGFPEPPQGVPCDGEGCRGPGSSAPALATNSATSSVGGPGNVKKAVPKHCRKGQVKKKGHCVKKKKARKHHKKGDKAKGGNGKKSRNYYRAGADAGAVR